MKRLRALLQRLRAASELPKVVISLNTSFKNQDIELYASKTLPECVLQPSWSVWEASGRVLEASRGVSEVSWRRLGGSKIDLKSVLETIFYK